MDPCYKQQFWIITLYDRLLMTLLYSKLSRSGIGWIYYMQYFYFLPFDKPFNLSCCFGKKDATTKPKLAFELIWACHRCFHSLPSQSWHFLMHFKVNERLIIYYYGAFKRIISTQKFLPTIFDTSNCITTISLI